jgi:hypothetical protein
VIERNEHASRALGAFNAAIDAVPGDADHPGYETLEALVDGRLDEVDQEVVQSHISLCSLCAEDLADLRATRDSLQAIAPIRSTRWRIPAIAAAAAAVLIAVWIAREPAAPVEPPQAAAPPTQIPPVAVATAPDLFSADERALIDRIIAANRLEIPESIAGLRGTPGTLLGSNRGTTLAPIAPLGTAVTSLRPSFSWSPVRGAQAYSVAVYDDRFKEVAKSPRITETTWVATGDLPRDRSLSWQVTAHLNGSNVVGPAPPQPEARFRILDQAAADAAAALRARLTSRPLELAILLARAGLVQDAADQLRRAEADAATASAARALRATLP